MPSINSKEAEMMTKTNTDTFVIAAIFIELMAYVGYVVFGNSFEESLLISIFALIIVLSGIAVSDGG